MMRQAVEIQLVTSLNDIPDGESCDLCGSSVQKLFIDHQVTGDLIVVKTRVAGYHCPNCDTNSYSNIGMVESLTKAQEILRHEGDPTAVCLDESIKIHKELCGLT